MRITEGGLDDPRVVELLRVHLARARAETAPGSAHALDLTGLRSPDVTFWSAWDGESLLGVGALKRLSADHGEVKSMHTAEAARRRGVGSAILRHIIDQARARGMSRLSLETGSWPYFEPARTLYARHGFVECPPFGDYRPDPNSVFMTLQLSSSDAADRGRPAAASTGRSTCVKRHIDAPRAAVYRALLDPGAIAKWKVPDGMTAHVHEFDAREGGAIRVSLTYDDPTGTGKTTSHTDTYRGRFVKLVPNEQVVEVDEFETADPALRGEMTITIALAEADGGTDLLAVHDGLPPGLSPADNETGWRMALEKLAALVEGARATRPYTGSTS